MRGPSSSKSWRRWRLFGHILRWNKGIPANNAMITYFVPSGENKYKERPQTTIHSALNLLETWNASRVTKSSKQQKTLSSYNQWQKTFIVEGIYTEDERSSWGDPIRLLGYKGANFLLSFQLVPLGVTIAYFLSPLCPIQGVFFPQNNKGHIFINSDHTFSLAFLFSSCQWILRISTEDDQSTQSRLSYLISKLPNWYFLYCTHSDLVNTLITSLEKCSIFI